MDTTYTGSTAVNGAVAVNQVNAAEAAEAQRWLEKQFGSIAAAERDNRALLDIVQFLAIEGVSYFTVAKDAIVHAANIPLEVGKSFDLYTKQQLLYARNVNGKLLKLGAMERVNNSLIITKPYLKQRQQVRIDGELSADLDGVMSYPISIGYSDVTTGSEPDWDNTDYAGGQSGELRLYPTTAQDGSTAYYIWRGTGKQAVALGTSEIMDLFIQAVLNGDNWKLFTQLIQTEPTLKANSIRRSHRAQLVFWQAFKVFQGVIAYAQATAPVVDPVADPVAVTDSTADATA